MTTALRETNHKYNCYRFEGKVAVLTAATMGDCITKSDLRIGLCTADRLGHEGAKLVISSRLQEHVDHAIEELVHSGIPRENVCGTVCHVGNAKHRQALLDLAMNKFGRIDILISNAGINPALGDILNVDQAKLDRIFEINVKCSFLLARQAVPYLELSGGGSIIFNSSVCGYRASPGMSTYGLSKTALFALVHSLSQELAPKKIRVNSVTPGPIKTEMGRVLFDHSHPKFELVAETANLSMGLFGRIGEPEEVASAAAYLASEDSSYVTGENHLIACGVHCRL
ncbi:Dehydrogenase/reductase SDR family member 4 [Aphelenchoides bicaudatus]|nr:Dehydrogenase/reductase SDR family member 4 [Aphelenchoides bicaudatus]